MKKRILLLVGILLVLVLTVVLLLPSEPTPPPSTTIAPTTSAPATGQTQGTTSSVSTSPTTIPTFPGTTAPYVPPTTSVVTLPTGTTVVTTPPPPPTTTLPPEPGVVRLYTCDSQTYETYVALAGEYYAETGTEVVVLMPEEGRDCQDALTELLASEAPPTIFCIHSEEMMIQLQEQLLDLSGTTAANALYSDAFAYTVDGRKLALAADVAGSGLLYNAAILAQPVGFTQTDFHNFADLQYIFNYITANRSRLDVYALAAPEYANTRLMETLAGLFADADQLRSFVDLYVKNTTSRNTTDTYFLKGTTVFYIGSTEDYHAVSSLGSNKLGFLPAYAKGTTAVQCICSHYWAVNAATSAADRQVSVDFLGWLVTDQADETPVDRLQMLSPYRDATHYDNTLQKQLRSYLETGNARLSWRISGKVADVSAFATALRAYVVSPSDETWATIADMFQ